MDCGVNNEIDINSVPIDPITAKLAIWPKRREAKTPNMPMTNVANAAGSSHEPASQAASPALAPNASVYMRMMQYAPTFVMMANNAATGAGALAYVPGNQNWTGTRAALMANTNSNNIAPVCRIA